VYVLKGETASLKEVQERKQGLFEAVLQHVNNLASSYDNIKQNVSRNQHNEKTNGETSKTPILFLKELEEFKLGPSKH
jgi:hypothetical protein